MTNNEARRAIEAILMVAEEPIEPSVLAQLTEQPKDRVIEICQQLAEQYEAEERGFVLARVAGGFRFQSHPDLAPYVERFVLDGKSARLSAPRSRRWRSSPTSNRCRARKWRRSAASMSIRSSARWTQSPTKDRGPLKAGKPAAQRQPTGTLQSLPDL